MIIVIWIFLAKCFFSLGLVFPESERVFLFKPTRDKISYICFFIYTKCDQMIYAKFYHFLNFVTYNYQNLPQKQYFMLSTKSTLNKLCKSGEIQQFLL